MSGGRHRRYVTLEYIKYINKYIRNDRSLQGGNRFCFLLVLDALNGLTTLYIHTPITF